MSEGHRIECEFDSPSLLKVSIGPYTTFDDAIDDLKWLHDNLPHGQIYHKFPVTSLKD